VHRAVYSKSLSVTSNKGEFPLHRLLVHSKKLHDIPIHDEVDLMVIDRYKALVKRVDRDGNLPFHIECSNLRRLTIISRLIQLYPKSLSVANKEGDLPLHRLLLLGSRPIQDINDDVELMMIIRYRTALKHQDSDGNLPLYIECNNHCRSSVIK
jgi:ankyrin repeat protein